MGIRGRNDLDRLLDGLAAGGGPEAAGHLAPLLHPARLAAASLARSVPADAAADHIEVLREDRARNVVVMPAVRRPQLSRAAFAVLVGAMLLFGAAGMVAASANAIPGSPLYGVKRAVERISLAMHRDPVGRAALHLEFAQHRLDEIQILVARGKDAAADIQALNGELNAAESDALHALALGQNADALLAHVHDMIAKHIDVLNRVLGQVPPQAQDAIRHAIDNAQKANEKIQHGRTKPKPKGPKPGKGKPTSHPGNAAHP